MTTENHDNQTNLVGGRSVLSFVVTLVLVQGCLPVEPPPPFDTEAFKSVVRDVYGQPEGTPTIFIDAEDLEQPKLDSLRTILKQDLDTEVRPLEERQFDDALPPFTPIDPVTREPGVTVVLARPNFDDISNQITIKVSFVRSRGLQRGCTDYTLAREGDERPITGRAEAWSGCPIPEELVENYDVVFERVHSSNCQGRVAVIGSCGEWEYIFEGRKADGFEEGNAGATCYFDPNTNLCVARITRTFARFETAPPTYEPIAEIVFGDVDCVGYEWDEMVLCAPDGYEGLAGIADQATLDGRHAEPSPVGVGVLLEHYVGNLDATYYICEQIRDQRSASRCWTGASGVNPESRDEICDRMLDHIDDPYEEECRLGIVWPLEY